MLTDEMTTCGCEPDADEESYWRDCDYCGTASRGRYCLHDGRQEPCPECDVVPVAQHVADEVAVAARR